MPSECCMSRESSRQADPGHALLRVSVMATHEESQLAEACEKIRDVGRELGVISGAS